MALIGEPPLIDGAPEYLASRSIIEGTHYERLWQKPLRPMLETSLVNRYLGEIFEDSTFRYLTRKVSVGNPAPFFDATAIIPSLDPSPGDKALERPLLPGSGDGAGLRYESYKTCVCNLCHCHFCHFKHPLCR
ncbi:MAG: hypothetical protein EHM79_04255 [Geobacter sp.]|nr:MAG: hypothetical protein EHM79_04255 [Geobacter sp.]